MGGKSTLSPAGVKSLRGRVAEQEAAEAADLDLGARWRALKMLFSALHEITTALGEIKRLARC